MSVCLSFSLVSVHAPLAQVSLHSHFTCRSIRLVTSSSLLAPYFRRRRHFTDCLYTRTMSNYPSHPLSSIYSSSSSARPYSREIYYYPYRDYSSWLVPSSHSRERRPPSSPSLSYYDDYEPYVLEYHPRSREHFRLTNLTPNREQYSQYPKQNKARPIPR